MAARYDGFQKTLGQCVWACQLRTFYAILLTSVVINASMVLIGMVEVVYLKRLLPEFILLFVILFFIMKNVARGLRLSFLKQEAFRTVLQVFLCLAGWVISISFGVFVFYIVQMVTGDPASAIPAAAFLTGGMWVLIVLYFFSSIKNGLDNIPDVMDNIKPYDLLWPLILAFMLLLVPMLLQDIGNSENFHEMMEAKPPLRRT